MEKTKQIRIYEDYVILKPRGEEKKLSVIPDGTLIVQGEKILFCGTAKEAESFISESGRTDPSLDFSESVRSKGEGKIIFPPFANCHTHLAMSLFRGSPVNLNLQDWLFQWIFPKEAKMTVDDVYAGASLSLLELMKSGCAATADMYYMEEGTAAAALEAGTRIVLTIDGKSRQVDGTYTQDEKAVADFADKWKEHTFVRPSLQVHSPYLYQADLYPELGRIAEQYHLPVQVHAAENRNEVQELRAKYGATPAELLERWNLLQPGSILAHNLYHTDNDLAILKKYPISLVTNPASNCKLGSGIADTEKQRKLGLDVVLGTDGAGSNDTLDMFRELRLAGFLAKAKHEDPLAGMADEWLYWATTGGYRAMGFRNAGSLEQGEAADFVIYNPYFAGNEPYIEGIDPISLLTYSGEKNGVEAMMVNGRYLIKDKEMQTVDEESVIFKAREAAKRVFAK